MVAKYTYQSTLPFPTEVVFAWHERTGALERLIPHWEDVRIIDGNGSLRDGTVRLQNKMLGIGVQWVVKHQDYVPGRQFCDVQVDGPFASWRHVHRFEPVADGCMMIDEVEYELPLGPPGEVFGGGLVRRRLDRVFAYRHRVVAQDLRDHAMFAAWRQTCVAMSGSGGLVGSALVPLLTTGGHEVRRIVRRPAGDDGEIAWRPETGEIEGEKFAGVDAVVHLAGENVLARWTARKKASIRASRVDATAKLAAALVRLPRPPRAFVAASAIGYYGDRGDEILTESSGSGAGFLAEVCEAWEAAAAPLADAGVRVVHLRIGIVLTPRSGALRLMLPAFRAFLGGTVGAGCNWLSWVSIEDLCGLLYRAAVDEACQGVANAVSPAPVTQREFVRTLAGVLKRPAGAGVPAVAARAVLGQLAGETVLASQKVLPTRVPADHPWRHRELDRALRQLLGTPGSEGLYHGAAASGGAA